MKRDFRTTAVGKKFKKGKRRKMYQKRGMSVVGGVIEMHDIYPC